MGNHQEKKFMMLQVLKAITFFAHLGRTFEKINQAGNSG